MGLSDAAIACRFQKGDAHTTDGREAALCTSDFILVLDPISLRRGGGVGASCQT